jgi:glutamyl-tRNA reductase
MNYVNIEISFRTAAPDVLELLPTLTEITANGRSPAHAEMSECEFLWLSTCNRLELFCAVDGSPVEPLLAFVADSIGCSQERLRDVHVVRQGHDAVEHLVRLATGLESMAIGEEQIVGQIRAAFLAARHGGAAGPRLTRAFDHAMHVAKRVRTETALGRLGLSLLEHGIEEAAGKLGGLRGRRALVVGLGAIGAQAVQALCARGAGPVHVVGRSRPAAHRFVERHQGMAQVEPGDTEHAAGLSDIVVTATSARHPLIRADRLRAVRGDTTRPQVLLDLARPRDVEPECGELPGVVLLNIDRLATLLDDRGMAEAIDHAVAIVAEESVRFAARSANASAGVIIRAMRSTANQFVEAELTRLEQRLPALSPDAREETCVALHRLVGKVLHEPLVRARTLCGAGNGVYFDALTELFCASGHQLEGEHHAG